MALYTMYWPDWMCSGARELGLDGKQLQELWGGHNQDSRFSRFKVGPGDRVVPITSIDGVVFALAMIVVKEKSTFHSWIDAHPDASARKVARTGDEVLSALEGKGVALAFHRAFTSEQLAAWRYDGSDGPRPLKHLKDGKLGKPLSIQGVYRVRPETEPLVEATLALDAKKTPRTKSSELEAQARAKPDDEALARVLADAWQDEGELRGEVSSLELALAKAREPKEVNALDERHAKVMRGKGAKKLGGGFPYRPWLGGRTFTRVTARLQSSNCAEAWKRWGALLDRFFSEPELQVADGKRVPVAQLRPFFDALGATSKPPHSIWDLPKRPSLEDVEALFALDSQASFVARGALQNEAGARLPFQASSQWLGTRFESELRLTALPFVVSLVARVPDGSPLAPELVKALQAWAAGEQVEATVETLRRTESGDRRDQG